MRIVVRERTSVSGTGTLKVLSSSGSAFLEIRRRDRPYSPSEFSQATRPLDPRMLTPVEVDSKVYDADV